VIASSRSPRTCATLLVAAKEDLDISFSGSYRMKSQKFRTPDRESARRQERGESVVFATVERKSGQVIGSTVHEHRCANRQWRSVPPGSHRRGSAPQSIRKRNFSCCVTPSKFGSTPASTENRCTESEIRAAILRIGAREEGTLRRHVYMDGACATQSTSAF